MYIEERFKTRLERNQRKDELNKTHAGVVIWSNPVKVGMDGLKSVYETEWIVSYPPQLIETEEQYLATHQPVETSNGECYTLPDGECVAKSCKLHGDHNEGTTEQEHQAADGVSEVLLSQS